MAKPLTVVIPHQLGRQEARRRIETGIHSLKKQFEGKVAAIEEKWQDDRLAFNVQALGQGVSGTVDIGDDSATVEVQLPWMLQMIAEKAKSYLQREGTLLLDKKK